MPLYETTFITRQDLPRQDVVKLAEQMSGIVEQGGGQVVKNEYWGLKSLAYKINKSRKGHFTMLAIDAPAKAIKEMERNLGINEDVIRQLTIKVDAHEEGPSVMMSQRRDDSYGQDNEAPSAAPAAAAADTDETETETKE